MTSLLDMDTYREQDNFVSPVVKPEKCTKQEVMSKQHGKQLRQKGAIKRTEASILAYEKKLKSSKSNDEKKLLKKKIERAQTTIKNTKII